MRAFFIIVVVIFIIFSVGGYFTLLKPAFESNLKLRFISIVFVSINFIAFLLILLLRTADVPDIIKIITSFSICLAFLLFSFGLFHFIFELIFSLTLKIMHIDIYYKERLAQIFLTLFFGAVALSIYGAWQMPIIKSINIPIKGLKNNISLLQISDLHISALMSKEKIIKIIKLANNIEADAILLTGDLIDAPPPLIMDKLKLLKHLNKDIYFILGNHEFIYGAFESISAAKQLGFNVLVNQNVAFKDSINLIGLSDIDGYRAGFLEPNLAEAMEDANEDLPNIVLAHQPNMIHSLKNANIDLMIAGHTHGGQIFPFNMLTYLFNPFLYGLKNINGVDLYISKGAGVAVSYARLFVPSEINLINLIKENNY